MHNKFMREAYKQAIKAREKDEIPVGAVVVHDGKIIARGHNIRERTEDPTGHAEIVALRKAARKIGSWRLINCDVYVTLEPCAMCAGAMVNARVRALYFGAYDPKAGACGSVLDVTNNPVLNHRVQSVGGVMREECAQILSDYFKGKRQKAKA